MNDRLYVETGEVNFGMFCPRRPWWHRFSPRACLREKRRLQAITESFYVAFSQPLEPRPGDECCRIET